MRIVYEPTGINNFHNCGPITLIVKGGKEADSYEGPIYRINKAQAKRLENHFCGMSDCHCPKGAVIQLDPDGLEFGIPAKWCNK